jgi:hypothetical protein
MLANDSWQVLEAELRQLKVRGRPIRFVTNPGNAGDGLIAAGTWQFFDQMRLHPIVSKVKQVRRGDIAIYSGGGNLVPEYPACKEFLERCLEVGVDRALILPHTIRGHEQLLASLDERFTLVCRDTESLDRVRVSAPRARVVLAAWMSSACARVVGASRRGGASRSTSWCTDRRRDTFAGAGRCSG